MAIEKKWLAIAPRLLSADGTTQGLILLNDAREFRVKMRIVLQSSTKPALQLQIKRVTKTGLIVGPPPQANTQKALNERADISAYLVAHGAYVYAEEQDKSMLKPDDADQATYEQEPVVAKRVINVDQFGNFYETENPLPVRLTNGSVNIGTVNADLEVALTHKATTAKPVPDSVRVGDGVDELSIRANGSVDVNVLNTLVRDPYDDVNITYNVNDDIEKIEFRLGVALVATLNFLYNANDNLFKVTKT